VLCAAAAAAAAAAVGVLRFGQVVEVRIITDRETNMCKGYCFIAFATRDQAESARQGEGGEGDEDSFARTHQPAPAQQPCVSPLRGSMSTHNHLLTERAAHEGCGVSRHEQGKLSWHPCAVSRGVITLGISLASMQRAYHPPRLQCKRTYPPQQSSPQDIDSSLTRSSLIHSLPHTFQAWMATSLMARP